MPNHNQGYEITLGGVSSSTIPEFICESIKRQIVGNRRHTLEEVPNLEGAWLFPESPGVKEITLECALLADSFPGERRTAARNIAAWAEAFTWTKMICGDDPDWYHLVVLSDSSELDEWRHLGEFELVFQAAPYAVSNTISTYQEVSVGASSTFNVTTNGTVRTYPIIQVTPSGSVTFIDITINGRTARYETTSFSAVKTFNSIAKLTEAGTNTDTNVEGDWSGMTLDMGPMVEVQYPYLEPGVNSVTVAVSAGGFTADFSWRDRA